MILSVTVAFLQTLGADLLVVDGFAVGIRTDRGWVKPLPAPQPITIGLSQVTLNGAKPASATFTIGSNQDATALISLDSMPSGVFYSGKAWMPRTGRNVADRTAAMASVAQFARNNGVTGPRPYLLQAWEIDIDGTGRPVQIISATSRPNADGKAQPRDWEAVLLRSRGQVYPLSFSFPKNGEALAQCRLRAVADFDGDGKLEFVTTSKLPSFMNISLWSFRDGKLTPTLDATYEISS